MAYIPQFIGSAAARYLKRPLTKSTEKKVVTTARDALNSPAVKTALSPIRAIPRVASALNPVNASKEATALGTRLMTPQQKTKSPLAVTDTGLRGDISTPPSPASINTAVSPAPDFQTQGDITGGFTSTDPAILKRVAEMNTQATQKAPTAPTSPTQPTSTLGGVSNPSFLQKVAQDNLSKLQERYLATLTPTERERALQTQLTDYIGQANLGIAGLEGQGRGIPLGLVRGQQAQLQEQANLSAQTLEAQLANEQAARNAEQQALTAQLGFEEQRRMTEAEQGRPFEFGGNLVKYNPATGQLEVIQEGTAASEGFTLSEGQARYDAQGNLIALGLEKPVDALAQQKQLLEIQKLQNEISGGGDFNKVLSVKELQDLGIPTSLYGITNGEVMQRINDGSIQTGEQIQTQMKIGSLEEKIKIIDSLLAPDSGMRGAVGSGIFSRGSLNLGRQRDFKATVDLLTSQQTLDTLRALKESGATLGAVSEAELAILEAAGSKIRSLEDPNNPGKYLMKEADFVAELNRIKDITQKAIDAARQYLGSSGGDDIDQFLDSFSNAQSGALNGSFGNLQNTQGLPKEMTQFNSVLGKGTITGYGSKFWDAGLDFVLPGGKNADVKLPANAKVLAVRPANQTGGFGNQVQVQFPDGKTLWISHLDRFANIKPGQVYPAGTIVGKQGNTGKTYGRTGIHLDLTMPKPGGGYYTAEQVAAYLRPTNRA